MEQLEILLGITALVLLVPASVLFIQVLMSLLPEGAAMAGQSVRPRLAILIPAHNESLMIADTLATILPQLVAGDGLLVVADNCSDDTADIARASGAEVIERSNLEHRGKGYALDFGVRHLENDPPEVAIVIDADCRVGAGAIDRMARQCGETGRPIQALYLMTAPAGGGLKLRIAEFAWRVRNWVRPLGSAKIGWPCQLMGTGMAFPWPMAARMPLANANIVEDMKLGIELALAGTPPLFCPEARVCSEFPVAAAAVKSQRTRWEHGHLNMILRETPHLLGRALLRIDVRALGLALDLLVPPLALLVLLQSGMLALAGLATVFGAGFMPLLLAAFGMALTSAAVLLAWLRWGQQVVSPGDLLSVPFYVLAKIPLYFRFWTRRQKEWVKTERN